MTSSFQVRIRFGFGFGFGFWIRLWQWLGVRIWFQQWWNEWQHRQQPWIPILKHRWIHEDR
jgi:hypothetical protein